jgi:signal transduction histidine kinase
LEHLRSRPGLERLLEMQHQVLRGYFRLLEADRMLRARTGGAALERERRRLGRELHTGVGQALAGIHIHLAIVQESLAETPESVRLALERIGLLAHDALEQVHAVSRGLWAPAWQAQPLPEALRNLWNTSGVPQRFDAVLDVRELASDPPPQVRAALYRAAQEGLTNAIRHSQARRVRLSLREEGGRIILEVADDGRGFELDLGQPRGSAGIGLHALRELAAQLGGEFQVNSSPKGTRVAMSFPR